MKLSRKAAAAVLAAALTLSLCVISALPGGQPRMDAMTYNIDTLPARDLRPVVDGPETEADYTPPGPGHPHRRPGGSNCGGLR